MSQDKNKIQTGIDELDKLLALDQVGVVSFSKSNYYINVNHKGLLLKGRPTLGIIKKVKQTCNIHSSFLKETSKSIEVNTDLIVSDFFCSESKNRWQNICDLEKLLKNKFNPIILCGRNIFEFWHFLKSISKDTALTPILLYGKHLIIGPKLSSQLMAQDWCNRLEKNLPSLQKRLELEHRLIPLLPITNKIIQILFNKLESYSNRSAALVVDLISGAVVRESFIGFSQHNSLDTCLDVSQLVSKHFGIIKAVGSPQQSYSFFYNISTTSNILGEAIGGASGLDLDKTRARAIYECLERYGSIYTSYKSIKDTFNNLQPDYGWDALRPFSESQYDDPSFNYENFSKTSELDWIKVRYFQSLAEVFVPEDIIIKRTGRSKRKYPFSTTGVALGHNRAMAEQSALYELAERDLLMRCFYLKELFKLRQRDIDCNETEVLVRNGLRIKAYLCKTSFPVYSILVSAEDPSTGAAAFGSACSSSFKVAISHAIEEAMHMLVYRITSNLPIKIPEWVNNLETWQVNLADFDNLSSIKVLSEYYNPVSFEYENSFIQGLGFSVVKLWSSRALDFVKNTAEAPKKLWNSESALKCLAEQKKCFFS